ncbi:MAG: hypothetical protein Tsb0013_00890 [Phycisphaerales bacterium]
MIHRTALGLTFVALTGASAAAQQLPVLLEINVADPSAVVITPTGNAATVMQTVGSVAGFTMTDLFATDFSIGFVTPDEAGTLMAPGMPGPYNRIANDFGAGNVDANDLNIWASGVGGEQQWTTSVAAFSGTWTLDLTGALFPAPGTRGDIWSDDSPNSDPPQGAILGAYIITPAPGAGALLAMGGVMLTRRRR